LDVPIGAVLEYAIRGAITVHYIADDCYPSLSKMDLNKFIVDINRKIEMSIRIIERSSRISEATKKPWHAPSKPEFLISKDSLRIFREDLPALKKRLKAENNKEDKKVMVKKKAKDDYDDVKLKMHVEWKGSYKHSNFEVSLRCDNLLDNEFKLAPRFRPALYLLVKGVCDDDPIVDNSVLKKAYRHTDEAKKEISKAFVNSIGARGKEIIKVENGVGKKLMLPKKNIKLTVNKPPP
jgi:hypothetical protein